MTRPLAIGALIAGATACSGLLGLDTVVYDLGDASVSAGMDSSPGPDAIADGGGCDAPSLDVSCPDSYYATVMGDHPVAYFRLSEPALPGKLLCHNEVACSPYTCSYSPSGVTFGAKGENPCATAVRLDPATGSVTFSGADGALDFPGDVPFSIEAWLEPDPVDGAVPLVPLASAVTFATTNALYNGYLIFMDGIGPGPRDEMWVMGKLAFYSQIHGLPVPAVPFHLVLVHSDVDHLDHLYLDGSNSKDDYPTGMAGPGQPLRPASGQPLQWRGFAGTLGEVAIYDRALTQEQINAHFLAGGS